MPDLLSAALFERDERVLAARRRPDRPPFAGYWLLPMVRVRDDETAEAALTRHARDQFGVGLSGETFADTVYLEDPTDAHRYVANIFRAEITDGPMQFRADGEYDDARWLAASELEQTSMPDELRLEVVRILSGEASDDPPAPEPDWAALEAAMSAPSVPLAERDEAPPTPDAPPADNRASWDAISEAYQAQYYGDRDAGRLKWSVGVFEDELRLLDDVRGKRAIVLGCGGGQDVVALERMGARAVGIDLSPEQIAYARKYALRQGAENSSFVEGTMEDLSRFDDESFDVTVSIHALAYAQDLERVFAEAARVLKPASVLAISVPHPTNQVFGDDPPYPANRAYWDESIDWTWELEGTSARFVERTPTVSGWFSMLTNAGFQVERIVEPYQGGLSGDDAQHLNLDRARRFPWVIIFKARKR